MQLLRHLTGRGCLNEAPKARSEFCGPPRPFPDPGCPVAKAAGSQPAGRILLPSFLVRARKEGRPPGRVPASQPQPSTTNVKQQPSKFIAAHAAKTSATTTKHHSKRAEHPQNRPQHPTPNTQHPTPNTQHPTPIHPVFRNAAAIPLIEMWMPSFTRSSPLPSRQRRTISTCRWCSGSM